MSKLLLYRLLTLAATLAFVSTFYVVTKQSDVIEQQKITIREMAANPQCLVPADAHVFDGDIERSLAPVVTQN